MFEAIKSVVTVPMALSRYTDYRGQKRIPCPIHGGKDNNFSVREDSFTCFVCGARGDVVSLVSYLMNVPMKEAAEILESDFGISRPDDLRKVQQEYETQRQKRERLERIEQRACIILCARHRKLWQNRRPETEGERVYVEHLCDFFLKAEFNSRIFWISDNMEYLRRLAECNSGHTSGTTSTKPETHIEKGISPRL